MKRFIEDDIRFLQKRLFEEAMEFVYQKKHDCDYLQAVIMSKENPPMMKLDQAPSLYEKKIEVAHHSFVVNGIIYDSYYPEMKRCTELFKSSFCDVITNKEDAIDCNALHLNFFFSEDSERLHGSVTLYLQTKENLIDETIQWLSNVKKDDTSDISSYLTCQSFLFDEFFASSSKDTITHVNNKEKGSSLFV